MPGVNESHGQAVDAFGGMGRHQAGIFSQQYSNPMSQAFGWNPSAKFEGQLQDKLAQGNPFAQYLNTTRNLFAPMQADAARAGQMVASQAPGTFAAYMQQAQNYLRNLPGYEQQMGNAVGAVNLPGAQHGVDAARQMLDQAQSPIQGQALYQNALRQSLASSREGAAGRGLGDSGSQQGLESTMSRDLAAQFAQNQTGNQQQALSGYEGALGGQGQLAGQLANLTGQQAQLGESGMQVGQNMMQSLPAYAQLLQAGSQMPFQTAQQLQGFLGASQSPTMSLLQAVAPQIAQQSKGWKSL